MRTGLLVLAPRRHAERATREALFIAVLSASGQPLTPTTAATRTCANASTGATLLATASHAAAVSLPCVACPAGVWSVMRSPAARRARFAALTLGRLVRVDPQRSAPLPRFKEPGMSISAPRRPSSVAIDPKDRTSHESAHEPSQRRTLPRLAVDGGVARLPGRRVHRLEGRGTRGRRRRRAGRRRAHRSRPCRRRSGGPPRARSGARRHGSAPAPSATPSGWRRAPRWWATRPTSARSP